MNLRRSTLSLLSAFAVAGFVGTPAVAQPDLRSGFGLRVFGTAVETSSQDEFRFDLASGFGLGLEYRFSPRLGLALQASSAELSDSLNEELFKVEPNLRITPLTLQLDWHLTPGRRVDVHVGPVVGWVRTGELEVIASGFGERESVAFDTDDDLAFGAHLDLDVPVGEGGTFFTAGVTYLKNEVEIHFPDAEEGEMQSQTFDLDPLIVRLGFGYRF